MPKRSVWNFHTANRLLFGSGAVRELGAAARRLAVQRVIVVTDTALVEAGVADKVRASLQEEAITVEVFDGGEPEPSFDAIARATSAARAFKPDAVVGLGGGSNMDLAKCTALLLTHSGSIRDYLGVDTLPGPILPLICLPTTAGTGSEVSSAAVLTDKENNVKVAVMSQYLRPALALVDPELTLTCPKRATAASGIDALTHAIETYLATHYCDLDVGVGEIPAYEGKHVVGDCLAEQAIRLIGRHLAAAVNEPGNLPAREGMALGATLAGMAFSNCGVGMVHAMEYPIGPVLHCSHGDGNGLLLPYVMQFVLPARTDEMARIAELLGEDVSGVSTMDAAQRAVDVVSRLRDTIGIPARIRDLGGTEDQLPGFAAKAFAIKRLMALTPRATTEKDVLEVYRWAF